MTDELKLMLIQCLIIAILFAIIIFMLKQNIAIKNERRIGRYSIEPINDENISVFDKAQNIYTEIVKKLRNTFKKSKLIIRFSRPYEKYIIYGEEGEAIDFIIHKFVIGCLFVCLTVFSQVLQVKVLSLFELLIDFLVGYYIFDLYLIYKKKRRIKLIQNQMLRAIIIMNNAFKSGKSTIQAVYLASEELPEPINEEFKKIYLDMKYGLEVGVVFERFAKRIDIEEARYLSASLTTLNKTGGNIIKVFSSIEQTLFDRKKLQEELKNMTVSSNLVVKVLMGIPFVFILIIYFLNPSYFSPLFSSGLGYMVLLLIIFMFILYIWILQKIMKVKV